MRAPPIRDSIRGGASTAPHGASDRSDASREHGAAEPPALDVHRALELVVDRVRGQATTHPLRTLGVAAGVGYVLGRGMPSIVVRLGLVAMARVTMDSLIASSWGGATRPRAREVESDDIVADPSDAASQTEHTPAESPRRARGRAASRDDAGRRATDD